MFRVPDLTGQPCQCEECVVAGVSHRPVVRTPEGELHGIRLRRWYEAKEKFDRAWQRAQFQANARKMPRAIVQTSPEEER